MSKLVRLITAALFAYCLLVGVQTAGKAQDVVPVRLLAYSNTLAKMVYIHYDFYSPDQHVNIRYGSYTFNIPVVVNPNNVVLDPVTGDLDQITVNGSVKLLTTTYAATVVIKQYWIPQLGANFWLMQVKVTDATHNRTLITDQFLFNTFVYDINL